MNSTLLHCLFEFRNYKSRILLYENASFCGKGHFLLFFFSLCHILCYVILCYRYVNLSETYYEYFVSTIILVTCAL